MHWAFSPIAENPDLPTVAATRPSNSSRTEPMAEPDGPFTPLELAVVSDMQLCGDDCRVIGLRVTLFNSSNQNVFGLDLGPVNRVERESGGLRLGFYNVSGNAHFGLDAGLVNRTRFMFGLQIGLVNISSEELTGYQVGLVNMNDGGTPLPMLGILGNGGFDGAYLGQFTLGVNGADGFSPVQLAGIGNYAIESGDTFVPVQLAGIFNRGESSILQIAAGGNSGGSDLLLQVGGLFNDANTIPLQLGLGINLADAAPLQLGGFNHSEEGFLQIGWIGNAAEAPALQLGGFYNRTERGPLQLALLVNDAERTGLQLGSLNFAERSGMQLGLLLNSGEDSMFQLAALSNYGQSAVQISAINYVDRAYLQLGALNLAKSSPGLQLGIINEADEQSGLSLGLVNEADVLKGHQIGLINIAWTARFPFTILYNYNDGPSDRARTGLIAANWTPLQLTLYMPGQLFERDAHVVGLRLNAVYGEVASVHGLDAGLFLSSGPVSGIQAGLVGYVDGPFTGIQLGGLSMNQELNGIGLGLLYNGVRNDMNGIAISAFADTDGAVNGLQVGLIMNRGDSFPGIQLGGLNIAESVPVQIGWIGNYREGPSLPGPQIGLIFNRSEDSLFQLSGLVNVSTNTPLFQISGLMNGTNEPIWLQLSAGFNFGETVHLPQVGLANEATTAPMQLGALWNSVEQSTHLQMALIYNAAPMFRTEDMLHESNPLLQVAAGFNGGYDTYLQLGAVNYNGNQSLLQLGFANLADQSFLQVGVFNGGEGSPGVQLGFVNVGPGLSLKMGVVNVVTASDSSRGLMMGGWNYSEKHSGMMIGLFNYAEELQGMQIGLINVHRQGAFSILPGINF